MPRLFFGLEIPESIKTSVLTVKTDINGARWQSEAQLHLTLAFLGEVESDPVETFWYCDPSCVNCITAVATE